MNRKSAIITVGVSASGKTTWANSRKKENPKACIICRDVIRAEILSEKFLPFSWKKWNWKWEGEVTSRYYQRLTEAADSSSIEEIILADTNLKGIYRKELIEKLESLGIYDITTKVFHVTWEEAVERDNAREHGVGHSVLAKQFEQFEKEVLKVQQYVPSTYLDPAWIFDLDGTLAIMGDRGPFEWHKVGVDTPNLPIVSIAKALYQMGFRIVILSGRDAVCKEQTLGWLSEHRIPFINLFMRPEGNNISDDILKKELFWTKIAPNWQVVGVVDDRPKVARMWRSIGLNVLQVGNPYIEF